MPKKKHEEAKEGIEEVLNQVAVLPIEQEFGNGDMNVLKDKINEIIRSK